MVSSEDEDWADSCFTIDPNMLDSGWNSLKDALLETLNTENNPSPYMVDDSTEGPKTEIFSKVDTDDGRAEKPTSDGRLNPENSDDFWSSHRMEDVFLPTYNENSRGLDPEVDFVFQSVELERSTEDIFKIWDLDIPSESDPISLVSDDDDDSKACKLEDDELLDDLISGIADLALSPNLG
ncbi:hypothetical protein PHJA_000737400 [Phtheirospermum japonicum]|uniref:Uncharacterized protein n=1 Tax=Phtheirospermum japonicum TaxID=374723 RepID=A0A830BGA8_9LAMI|nr:hypothetical protein PHJA_000737400 [Phtheirospermum japonicum]